MIERGLKVVTGSLLVVQLLVLTWQVFSRYVLKDPSTVTEELSRLLLIWLGTLGTTLGFLMREHLAFDLLSEKASPVNRQRLIAFSDLTVVLFGVLMVVGGAVLFWNKLILGQTTPVLKIPAAYVVLVLPIAGVIVALSPFLHPHKDAESCN
jgi:TRAP-type C4-dicarboxylate transport system permease small subunit